MKPYSLCVLRVLRGLCVEATVQVSPLFSPGVAFFAFFAVFALKPPCKSHRPSHPDEDAAGQNLTLMPAANVLPEANPVSLSCIATTYTSLLLDRK
jgi:hypothetical protein